MSVMETNKTKRRILYEEIRLLTKDSFEAIRRLKKICSSKNEHYIFINDHIGDVVIALGYLKAFRKKNKLKHITLVITEKYRGLIRNYATDFENAKYVDSYELYRIFLLNLTRYGHFYLRKEYPNVTFVNPADLSLLGFDYFNRFPDLSLEKVIKYGDLGLSIDSEFIPPNSYIKSSKEFIYNKRVLFSLNARTVTGNITKLCENLVPSLQDAGYELFTNTEKECDCIYGTKPIFLKLEDIGEFISGGTFIGIRSGLHDLLAFYKCSLIAIYNSCEENISFFSIPMLKGSTDKVLEMVCTSNIQEDCRKITDFIGKANW